MASPTEVYPEPVWVGAPVRPGTEKRYEDTYKVTVRDPREYPFADIPVYAGFAEVGEDTKNGTNGLVKNGSSFRKKRERITTRVYGNGGRVSAINGSQPRGWTRISRRASRKLGSPLMTNVLASDGLLEQLVTPENKEPRFGYRSSPMGTRPGTSRGRSGAFSNFMQESSVCTGGLK